MSEKSTSYSKLIYNWQVLKLFLPYLKLSDILSSASVSKQWQYHLKQYIKRCIVPQLAIDSEIISGSSDSFHLIKDFLHRRLVMYSQNTVKEIQFHESCTEIEVGNHVTKITSFQGNTYIVLNEKLAKMEKEDWNNPTYTYRMPKQFLKARVVGNYVYLVNDRQLTRFTTTKQSISNNELIINFQGNIEHFITSISAALVVLTPNNITKNHYIFFTHKQPKPRPIQLNIQIANPQTDIILDYGEHGFVLNKEGMTYEVNFEEKGAKFEEYKMLKGKIVVKIMCGAKHYFAYEKTKKQIQNWTTAQVLQWAQKSGFDQYIKILTAQKLTGKKLLQMNKTYMEDVLGMTSSLTQQKINLLIQEQNQHIQCFDDYVVYYWGRNDRGQLCMNPSGYVNYLGRLKLGENMEIFGCFGDQTLLRNSKSQEITLNTLDENGKLQWKSLTNNPKIWSISGNKQFILSCQSSSTKSLTNEYPIHPKKQKLRTAKNIMDQIQWDSSLNQQEFSVGYTARYEGKLECSFKEFMQSDLKEYNVLYFKKNGKVVWDKKTRLDAL